MKAGKMADRKELIERKIEETFRGLDEAETIAAGPFFYTRLQARIGSLGTQREGTLHWIFSVRALRPAFLALLVALNVVSGVRLFKGSGNQSEIREENLVAFASTYSLSRSGYGY